MYNEANGDYLRQKLIDDVQSYRDTAEEKNDIMIQKQTTAIVVSSLWGAVWIGSALEAMIKFPYQKNKIKKLSKRRTNVDFALQNIRGEIMPGIKFSYNW